MRLVADNTGLDDALKTLEKRTAKNTEYSVKGNVIQIIPKGMEGYFAQSRESYADKTKLPESTAYETENGSVIVQFEGSI